MYYFHEVIKRDKNFTGAGDFSGPESPLDNASRKEFLQKYAGFARKWYSLDGSLYKKAVPEEKAKEALRATDYETTPSRRARLRFKKMRASLLKRSEPFKGWQLYYNAKVSDGAVIFEDKRDCPASCAKYSFDGERRIKAFSFKVFISREYQADLCIKPFITTTGRIIELRSGLEEVLKLQFYCNGEFYARCGVKDIYHHENIFVSDFEFDKWHEVRIELKEDTYTVSLDGNIAADIWLSSKLNPDTVFFSGGMHPIGKWQVVPLALEYGDKTLTEFFEGGDCGSAQIEELGEVGLPYGTGCFINKDKYLILEGSFEKMEGKAFLKIDSIDPCGKVYINGKLALKAENFSSKRVNIDPFLTEGKNDIKIVVEPRAPEVHYSWHRHKDTYNAWGCHGVEIFYIKDIEAGELEIFTKKAGKKPLVNVKFSLSNLGERAFKGRWELYLKKVYDGKKADGGEEFVKSGKFCLAGGENAAFDTNFRKELNLWSPEVPNLYEVRLSVFDESGSLADEIITETGFRTIGQKRGAIFLNDKKVMLNGALIMQFLSPYEEIPLNHTFPSSAQIIWQVLMGKAMNCNILRLHILGYGTNDERFARFCDRLGMMLVWTTRYIDSVESMLWTENWEQADAYAAQVKEVINHPSIVIWEGSNEFRGSLKSIDRIYDAFVSAVKKADTSRLLSPISHIYYDPPCDYFQEDGRRNSAFERVKSLSGWNDPLVIRSAHNYVYLLGYGTSWDSMRKQDFPAQPAMLKSRRHAYLITEYAVIGRQNPDTPEAKKYIKKDSYELPDEYNGLGFFLEDGEWLLSQAHQAICASAATKRMRYEDIDGMMWCCLTGGANDGSYLKPPIDFYGYPKIAFFALKEGFQPAICASSTVDVVWGKDYKFRPALMSYELGARYDIEIEITGENGETSFSKQYNGILADTPCKIIDEIEIDLEDGYYGICCRAEPSR